MNRIFSLGAFDRFNYGDLLFPLVLDRASRQKVVHLSLTAKDMNFAGGVETRSVKFADFAINDSIIVAGGDVLTANWFGAFWQLQKEHFDLGFRAAYHLLPKRALSRISRRAFSSDWNSPYVVPTELARRVPTAYNSVGGSDVVALHKTDRMLLAEDLSAARFLSVRDKTSQAALKEIGVVAKLFPDSVAAIALDEAVSGTKLTEGTLVFQSSAHWLNNNLDSTTQQLRLLQNEGWKIDFAPIGLSGGHSDLSAYSLLSKHIPNISLLPHGTVEEVRTSICSGEAFIGTSLHGHITAVAIGRPAVALPGVKKLSSYVQTWTRDISGLALSSAAIRPTLSKAMSVSQQFRDDQRAYLASEAVRGTSLALEALND